MKKLVNNKILLLLFILVCGISQVGARDIYVSPSGLSTGDGATEGAAVNFARLRTILAAYDVRTNDATLNVYFAQGTYAMTTTGDNSFFTFSATVAAISGLDVTFAPNPNNTAAVIFTGNGGTNCIRFAIVPSGTEDDNMTLNIEDVTFQNIEKVDAETDGRSSLFTVGAYATLNVNGVTFDNIKSRTNTIVSPSAANANINIKNSEIKNITSATNFTYFFRTAYANTSLSFDNCRFTDLTFYGAIFYFVDATDNCSLDISDCIFNNVKTAVAAGYFFWLRNSSSYISVTGTEFTQNRVGLTGTGYAAHMFYFTGTDDGDAADEQRIENNTFDTNAIYGNLINTTRKIKVSDNTFTGNTLTNNLLISSAGTYLSNNLIVNNTTTGGVAARNHFMTITGANSTVEYNTFDTNKSAGNYQANILYVTGAESIIHNNTFKSNQPYSTGYTVNIGAASVLMYNNTLSGNTVGGAITVTAAAKVINNTVYNSGAVYVSNTGARIINNIAAGNSTITASTTAIGNSAYLRNISGGNYCASGTTVSENTASAFASQFKTTLSGTGLGLEIHDLDKERLSEANHTIVERGGNISDLAGEAGLSVEDLELYLKYDQAGKVRPQEISLGAVDMQNFILSKATITIKYKGTLPTDTIIDLSDYISAWPEGVNSGDESYSFVGDPDMVIGTVAAHPSFPTVRIIPREDPLGKIFRGEFKYRVSATVSGLTYAKEGLVSVTIYDTSNPPGEVDPIDNTETCFDYMGAVEFTSDYRFTPRSDSETAYRAAGLTVPLVGDLNGDGYPEIIVFGNTGANSSNGSFRYIDVYNGQDGSRVARMALSTTSTSYTSTGYHMPACPGAIADVDGDGRIEIFVALPNGGSTDLNSRLTSYTIVPTGSTYTLQKNWTSTTKYNNNTPHSSTAYDTYEKVNPQIVDFDGDGDPEVFVLNKVYDAKTGTLKFTTESLATAYLGRNIDASYTYDRTHFFPYIHDMDGDGMYDIVAGGKIYLTRLNANGDFIAPEKIQMPGVLDGFTGVADIDGNGTPDVVVVRENDDNIDVMVWNPFEGTGGTPKMIAQRTITVNYRNYGSNSYVYIGDIDGRKDPFDQKRRPEIAVLTGRIARSSLVPHSTIKNIPVGDGAGQGGIPTSGNTGGNGGLFALTYDAEHGDLRTSFVLEHRDRSNNTGFTMFDFDNDGIQEICYRDETTLRIIKPTIPYVKVDYTNTGTGVNYKPDVIKFRQTVRSATAFEYPVIADIDNDASAEMVVMGADDYRFYGFPYVVGNGNGDKFAPALPVWNQFMYSPFKINPDLTVPTGLAKDPLAYTYTREIKDENGVGIGTIDEYQPYNGTLIQMPYFLTLPDTPYDLFEPIIFLTEASIVPVTSSATAHRPKIRVTGATGMIEITITNKSTAKTDIALNTPISVYKTNISQPAFLKKLRLNELNLAGTTTRVGSAIKAGDSIRVDIPIVDPYSTYYVRLGDDSGLDGSNNWVWRFGTNNGGLPGSVGDPYSNPVEDPDNGIGISSRAYRDCDWRDQTIKASLVSINSDAVTVQRYGSVVIDIFANDDFPNDIDASQKLVHNVVRTSPGPLAGTVSFTDNKVVYTHDGSATLVNNIDSFRYEVNYKPSGGNEVTFTAYVYIYVLESETDGFTACYGQNYETRLKENPEGIRFIWWDENEQLQSSSDSLTISFGVVTVPKIYTVKPLLSYYNGERLEFIPGTLAIGVLGETTTDYATMRWTGDVNTDWHNPNNWVEVRDNDEISVQYTPTACVDVIIPSGCPNYPELTSLAVCNNITMKDRAMIAGIHHLTYVDASVEIQLTASERDRFVMWSAPLKSMYSGDYHFKNGNASIRGDVYMNLFQQANPDGGSAAVNRFTATFGDLGKALPLGTAFNLKVTSTSMNKGKSFYFPQIDSTTYVDVNGKSYSGLVRTNGTKFITDGVTYYGDYVFDLDVPSYMATSDYIQVVNPYMAYLDMGEFYKANSNLGGYVIWNGNVSESFIQTLSPAIDGNRYEISTAPGGFAGQYVPPLQSFFVQRGSLSSNKVKMSPRWTTTTQGTPYVLRSETEETNILRIKATQGEKTGYAVLFYHSQAKPYFESSEDMHNLFFDEIPLEVYSFTPTKSEMLAINSSSSFDAQDTDLGLKVRDVGEVVLEFSGMETFGHDVTLIDKELKGKDRETLITAANPTYRFTVTKANTELNDRFSLRMDYTGVGLGNDAVEASDFKVYADKGYIYVQSGSGMISSVQVYAISGATVYSNNSRSYQFKIPADHQQVYIVKAMVNGESKVQKVFVK